MLNFKQLYRNNIFNLPEIGNINLAPFKQHPSEISPHKDKHETISNIFQSNLQPFKFNCYGYSNTFQSICAKENLFPFMIDVGLTKIAIISKECIVILDWKVNQSGIVYQGGDQMIKLQKYEKIKVSQVVSAVRVGRFSMYIGFQSGRISQYNFKTKSWQGISDALQFPVMQIEIVQEEQNKQSSIIALDSTGNIIHLTYSHKTFMDKIIKTLTTDRWISFLFRNKKREKIKKMFKGLINRQKEANQTESSNSEIENVPYNYNRFHLKKLNNDYLLCIYRRNQIQILILQKQYSLKKTLSIEQNLSEQKDQELAFIELGQGSFEKSNIKHHILAIGINQTIYFYKIIDIEQSYEILKISQINLEERLLFGMFISNNLILLGQKNSLKLANINEVPKECIPFDKNKFSYLDFFIDEENYDMDRKLINYNLLKKLQWIDNKKDKIFLCLEGKRLITGSIFNWQTTLYKLIQQQNWELSMRMYENIYNGQYKLCCSIHQNILQRNQEMSSLCKAISIGYIQYSYKQQKEMRLVINNVIYFLLKCDQSPLLFSYVEQYLQQNKLIQLFVDDLADYIEQKNGYNLKIPYISENMLNMVIKKYKSQKKEEILQQFFRHLDLNLMQKFHILTTCLREELYESLIYICCEQKDYITPIIKLCGIQLNQKANSNTRIADIIYWYLSECLLGRFTEYGNEPDYIHMLSVLINFIFIPSSLEMLLQTSRKYLIQIINVLFQPKILRHVLENEDKFFMRKEEEQFDSLFEQNCMKEYKFYEKMLSVLIRVIQNSKGQEKQQYLLELNKFLICIMVKNQFPFKFTMKIKTILFYIDHPFLFNEQSSNIDPEDNQILMNGHLMRLLDSLLRSLNEKCLSLRDKIKQDQKSILELQHLMTKQKQKELNKILQSITISNYNMQLSETKCYIHHELANYAEVLELYLKMNNRKLRVKIFHYLQNNLNQFQKLSQEFFKYLISLMNIDLNKTVSLLWNLKKEWVNSEQIIDKLTDYPNIQLGYIQKVAKNGIQSSKKLLLRHLQIVLRQKVQQIQGYIAKMDYPLQESFRMCEQFNNKKGKAFILIKSGRNMQGVQIITQIFLEYIQEYIKGIRKNPQFQKQKKDKIMSQFEVVLTTCNKEWIIDNQRGEQIWQKTAEIIFKKLNISNIDSQHIPQLIKDILNEIVDLLLENMLEQVSTDFFLNKFTKTFNNLPIRIFLQAYKIIFHRIQFTFTLEKLNKDLLEKDKLNMWHQMMKSIYHGHICNLACSLCNTNIGINERMISYDCKHIFHEQCYYEQNTKKNKNELCPLCFNSIDNYLLIGDQKIPRYKLQLDEKEWLKHKINKMDYYDKTTLMSAMQSWSKFQEWIDI